MRDLIPAQDRSLVDLKAELLSAAAESEKRAYASNTERAYAAAWSSFEAWCGRMGEVSLPARLDTLRMYLSHAKTVYKASTIELHLAAIRKCHAVAGHPLDLKPLADQRRGIRREIGTSKRSKDALTDVELVRILRNLGGDLPDLRDRAYLVMAFAGGFRRAELVGVDLDHIRFERDGLTITLPSSKGARDGEAVTVALKAAKRAVLCPVKALKIWLGAARIDEGPVFRPIEAGRYVVDARLTAGQVRRMVIKRAAGAGLKNVSPHSLRAGTATAALAKGEAIEKVAAFLRHKSIETTRIYNRKARAFIDHPLARIVDAETDGDPALPVPGQGIAYRESADGSVPPIRIDRLEPRPTVNAKPLADAMRDAEAASARAAEKLKGYST
jgi:integrase